MRYADLELNTDTREVSRQGKSIELTPREFALLHYLLQHPGRVFSKAEIAANVWDVDFDTGTNVVEVYVNYLRKKIDRQFDSKLIHTRPGMGYFLKEEKED
jgi:DNA-binding response OmpR family regulator